MKTKIHTLLAVGLFVTTSAFADRPALMKGLGLDYKNAIIFQKPRVVKANPRVNFVKKMNGLLATGTYA